MVWIDHGLVIQQMLMAYTTFDGPIYDCNFAVACCSIHQVSYKLGSKLIGLKSTYITATHLFCVYICSELDSLLMFITHASHDLILHY